MILNTNEIFQLRIDPLKETVTIIPIEGLIFAINIINLSDIPKRTYSPVAKLASVLPGKSFSWVAGWLWENTDPIVLDRVAKPDFYNGVV